LAAPALVATPAGAQSAEPPADRAIASDAGTDPDADGGARVSYPAFSAAPPSDEQTPRPKPEDWPAAERVAVDGESQGYAYNCEARRIHEWLRIHCSVGTGSISMLGGETGQLSFKLDPI